jgi:hypothetical protein
VGTSLNAASYQNLIRITTPVGNDCTASDGLNTICFAQSASFGSGVLAFATSITSDILGETFGPKQSQFIGQILDSDILFNPASNFATPTALPGNQTAFDLESVLIHELGHFFGFSHSGVMRAMMFPFAPRQGQFLGDRPTQQVPDGPLSEDDRAGLRVIYPNPADPNKGSISGRILPANPISLVLADQPTPGPMTGIHGAHVVAVDADTGAVIAGTLGGWSCDPNAPPTQFDGTYIIEGLPVGTAQNPRRYKVFAEPFDSPVVDSNIRGALVDLCRSDVPTPCTVPRNSQNQATVNTRFVTKVKP